jgi:NADH-quinone oxidoreductase subunit D
MPQIEEIKVSLDDIKHLISNRAIKGETVLLNMGPQHPSTHGVLRLLLELDGEIIVNCIPDIGYLHTGIEKSMENQRYLQASVMTDRMDYLNTVGNNLAYVLAVEKLTELEVPERATVIRVILTELQRIASHLIWLATSGLDIGAMTVFLYCFREREIILDILELVSGQRMMGTYIRPGGLWRDVPAEFEQAVKDFIDIMPKRIDEYESLLTKNPIFLDRTKGIGPVTSEQALAWGLTGPNMRASGVDYDIRRAIPYLGYENYEFEVPIDTAGDVYARYLVRIQEMRESLKIVQQGLDRLEEGPVLTEDSKFTPPRRSKIGTSMEALIHHFKYWTEGFSVPKGSIYSVVESPRGELGVYLESDGGPKPYRVHWRAPSFSNMQIFSWVAKDHFIADLVAIIGSVDIVLGDTDR